MCSVDEARDISKSAVYLWLYKVLLPSSSLIYIDILHSAMASEPQVIAGQIYGQSHLYNLYYGYTT